MSNEIIEDKELEALLGEETDSQSEVQEVCKDKEVKEESAEGHPQDGEPKEDDSQEGKEEYPPNDSTGSTDPVKLESSDEEDKEEDEDKEEACESKLDFSEDVKALEAAGEGLSEEFKAKAATIFEAAVTAKLNEKVKALEESYKEKLLAESLSIAETLAEKVDSYLNYVVANWLKENIIAIDSGLRTELAEKFISSMKNVFVENFVEVPESKRDLYQELEEKVKKIEESEKVARFTLAETTKKLQDYQRSAIIAQAAEGLASTQVDRLNKLVKDVEFFSEEAFTAKVKTIKESYFRDQTTRTSVKTGVSTSVLNEGTKEDPSKVISSDMKAYTAALSRGSKKLF